MNDVHVMQATILQHDQHAKYKDCVLWIDSLGKELQSLVKRCDILQGKLENVENEKLEDKDMCNSAKTYANKEAMFWPILGSFPRT